MSLQTDIEDAVAAKLTADATFPAGWTVAGARDPIDDKTVRVRLNIDSIGQPNNVGWGPKQRLFGATVRCVSRGETDDLDAVNDAIRTTLVAAEELDLTGIAATLEIQAATTERGVAEGGTALDTFEIQVAYEADLGD